MASTQSTASDRLIVSASLRRDEFLLSLDLKVGMGEVLGLTGDIGCGKTSALWLIAGRLRAETGVIALGESVLDQPSTSAFVDRRPISLMTQSYLNDLPEDLTGTEIVRQNTVRLNPTDPDPERTARETLAGLGVGDHVVDRLPWTFSGAEAQRVAMAAAIAPRPAVILLDEPFGALDKRTGAAVRQWLATWFSGFDGMAIVACTRVDHLGEVADRVISLDG